MSRVQLIQEYEERPKSKSNRKHCRDSRLHELEEQLEFAESRCGTLKQQLDYIKILYGCDRNNPIPAAVEGGHANLEAHGDNLDVRHRSFSDLSRWSNQNVAYGGGEGGKNLLTQAVSYTTTTRTSSNASRKNHSSKSSVDKRVNVAGGNGSVAEGQKHKTKASRLKKKWHRKPKSRGKPKSFEASSKYSNGSSQTQSQIWPDNVVEIYKNVAVSNVQSESGLETAYNSKRSKSITNKGDIKKRKVVSGVNLLKKTEETDSASKLTDFEKFEIKNFDKSLKEESAQTDVSCESNINQGVKLVELRDKEEEEENNLKSEYYENVKSYCQPTISSKRKQVERSVFTNLNVRNIPFIAATSTAPSHNIGINIQQVLSIIKKRQPSNEVNTNSDLGSGENSLLTFLSTKNVGNKGSNSIQTGCGDQGPASEGKDGKRGYEGTKTSMTYWKSPSEPRRENFGKDVTLSDSEQANIDWNFRVSKLKKVLVFLHEDFTNLSQKYKRLQKKLTKRNINKNDAKGELADIERNLEKKEEEITVVIGLYKEVINLREELKKYQDKNSFATNSKGMITENLKPTNSTHIQMTALLRKIQNFQEQLKI